MGREQPVAAQPHKQVICFEIFLRMVKHDCFASGADTVFQIMLASDTISPAMGGDILRLFSSIMRKFELENF